MNMHTHNASVIVKPLIKDPTLGRVDIYWAGKHLTHAPIQLLHLEWVLRTVGKMLQCSDVKCSPPTELFDRRDIHNFYASLLSTRGCPQLLHSWSDNLHRACSSLAVALFDLDESFQELAVALRQCSDPTNAVEQLQPFWEGQLPGLSDPTVEQAALSVFDQLHALGRCVGGINTIAPLYREAFLAAVFANLWLYMAFRQKQWDEDQQDV